ncbi:MAG: hypothetical protein QN181_10075, partial [Armatimonadota bacterium]|nr:hypothetical protein [Armatimonadota bacterium]
RAFGNQGAHQGRQRLIQLPGEAILAHTRAFRESRVIWRQAGLPVITNEIGQRTEDPNQTTAVMSKVMELGLPVAVWLSVDAPKARGLVNLDGSLRPTGEAFRSFVLQHVAPGWRR